MAFQFSVDDMRGERKIKKKTKAKAIASAKRFRKKGAGVSRIKRTFF